jgi:hypothetical protein
LKIALKLRVLKENIFHNQVGVILLRIEIIGEIFLIKDLTSGMQLVSEQKIHNK